MRSLLTLTALLLLGGCAVGQRGGGYFEDDGPHATAPDVSNVPDAAPRHEVPSASGNRPYAVNGTTYQPLADARGYRERGVASWYGRKFHGRRTSSGETYDMYAMSAAHKTLPLPSYVRVRNLDNDKSVVVRVNDRGPFLHNRLIDLSYAAAARLGIVGTGTGVVEVEHVGPDERPTAVVAAAPAAVTTSLNPISAAQAAGRPTLFVQLGAFTRRDNANALRERAAKAGLDGVIIQIADTPERRLHRVRIGPVASVDEADRIADQAGRLGMPDALIVVE
jgi:rare lipoprotein A